MSVLNRVEKDELKKFKVMVESNYPINNIYSVNDSRYNEDKTKALKSLGLEGKKITELNYENKMMFIFKMLINNGGYTVQRIFELMDKSNNAIRPRIAFQKVLSTMKSSSRNKKKTKRKKGTKGRKGTRGRKGTKGKGKGNGTRGKGTRGKGTRKGKGARKGKGTRGKDTKGRKGKGRKGKKKQSSGTSSQSGG